MIKKWSKEEIEKSVIVKSRGYRQEVPKFGQKPGRKRRQRPKGHDRWKREMTYIQTERAKTGRYEMRETWKWNSFASQCVFGGEGKRQEYVI